MLKQKLIKLNCTMKGSLWLGMRALFITFEAQFGAHFLLINYKIDHLLFCLMPRPRDHHFNHLIFGNDT